MWQAKFKNGEVLNEFDKKGQEVLFRKVLDRNDLESLSIILKDKVFTVRMSDGRFSFCVNEIENHFFASDVDTTSLAHIRPIYFVRETVQFNALASALTSAGPPKTNFIALGWQANCNGRNVKRYLAILPTNTFIIKSE